MTLRAPASSASSTSHRALLLGTALALLLAGLLGSPPPGHADEQAASAAVARLPALQGIRLDGLSKLARGRNAYSVKLGSKGLAATVMGTPGTGGSLVWSVVVMPGPVSLAGIVPGNAGTLGDLAITHAVVAVTNLDHPVTVGDLPPDLQRAISSLPGLAGSRQLELRAGVNLLATVQVARSGVLGEIKQRLGLATETATLRGSVGAEIIRFVTNGSAGHTADAVRALDLSLTLGPIAPAGLRGVIQSDDVDVTFKGEAQKVVAAGSARIHLTLPRGGRLEVPTTLTLDRAPPDRGSYFRFTGRLPAATLANLPHAPALALDALSLDMALLRQGTQRVPFIGVTGQGHVGRAPVTITGTLTQARSGPPELTLWAEGNLKLSDLLQAGAVPPGLDQVTLKSVSFGPGQVAASAQLGRKQITLVAWVPIGKRAHNVVVGAGGIGLTDFLPAVRHTSLDALTLASGAFVVVPPENAAKAVAARTLPDLAVQLLGGPQAPLVARGLDLAPGVNLFANLDVRASGAVKSLLEALGAQAGTLPLHGTLDPAMFAHTPWRRQNGSGAGPLPASFWNALNLEIPLPTITPPGAGKILTFKNGTLSITGIEGRASIVVATTVGLMVGGHALEVAGTFTSVPGSAGTPVLTFTGREKTHVPSPFGLSWLSLDEVDVGATLDRGRRKVDLTLDARATIGGRPYTVVTSFKEQGGALEDVVFTLKGRVPLAAIPGIGAIPELRAVELVDPEVSRTHVSGEIDLLKTTFKVALLEHHGQWDLLFQHSGFTLGELLPALRRTVLGEVAFPRAVLVLSQSGFTRPLRDFPPVIQPALRELGVGTGGSIHAEPGLSLVAALDPARLTGPFGKILTRLGIKAPVIVSGGIGGVLGGIPALNLQASLSSLPAMPVKALRPRPGRAGATLRLSFAGEQLTVGVGTAIGFRVGRDDLTFDASLNAALNADNVVLDVQGRLDGAWHNPAGIKGLTLDDVSLTLGVNEVGAIVVSLGGKAELGSNQVLVAAGASLLPEALGAPEAIGFIGRVDRLRLGVLADTAAAFVREASGAALPAGDTPREEVELHGATIALMTPGAYLDPKLMQGANVQITGAGVALAGTLVIDGKRLGTVSGYASDQGLKLSGDLAPFNVGPVALDRAALNATVALNGPPQFTMVTRARPFGAAIDLDVGLDAKGFHFTLDEQVGGQHTTSLTARTTKGFSLSRDNDFALHASLGPDSIGHIRELVKSAVDALFADLDAEARKLDQALQTARRALQTAAAEEAAARRAAQQGGVHTVAEAQARVSELKRRLDGLSRDIAAKHAAARQASQRLELRTAAELMAEAASLRPEQAGAEAALAVAEKVVEALKVGAALPPEADPRLLAAVTALEVAGLAVQVAEEGVSAARAVTADLRDATARIGEPAVLDVKRAVIDGTLATGASLVLDARLFGQRDVSVRVGYKVADVGAALASLTQAARQIATHLQGHKSLEHGPKPSDGTPGSTPAAPSEPVVTFDDGKFAVPVAQCGGGCRPPPSACGQVTPKDWYSQARPADAGACPAPPAGGCNQVVLGPAAEIRRYQGCPGYKVLDPSHGPPGAHDDFVACAAAGRVDATCGPPIMVASGWSKIPPTSGTARAMCQLKSCGWQVTLHENQPGSATPSTAVLALDAGKLRIPVSACVAQCPKPPAACHRAWSNQSPDPRGQAPHATARPDPAACPAPPRDPDGTECTQVVLGRIPDVEPFKGCRGYVVLNLSDWAMERNDEFIACTVTGQLGATCRTPVLIASGWKDTGGVTDHRGIGPATITAREMCQLRTCGWNVALHASTAGGATPRGSAPPPAAGPPPPPTITVKAGDLTVAGGSKPDDEITVEMVFEVSGDSRGKAIPWKIFMDAGVLAEGTQAVAAGVATYTVRATTRARPGSHDFHGAIDPDNTLQAPPSERASHVSARTTKIFADWPGWVAAAKSGIRRGFADWMRTLTLGAVTIHGSVATGGAVTAPSLTPYVAGPMLGSGVPQDVIDRLLGPVAEAWQAWARDITVPGLPWYPAFARWSGATAPPTPNVPTPLSALGPVNGALQPRNLSAAIRRRVGPAADVPGAGQAIDDFAEWLAEPLATWLSTARVTHVMGLGAVPNFAPPGVTAGPIVGTASGKPLAVAPAPAWR